MERPPPENPSRTSPSIEAAREWLKFVLVHRDVRSAWPLTAPEYRLALIQAIIYLNEQNSLLAGYDREDLARGLAASEADHPLWASFAALLVEEFEADLGGLDAANLKDATARPIAPGLELVLIPSEAGDPTEPPEMLSHGILMRRCGDRWLVAGLSGRPAVPGWPPDLGY
jgi:hypothetical protein